MEFREWLNLLERSYVDQWTVEQFERAFSEELHKLIARTKDAGLRSTFEKARTCPVRNSQGHCQGFVDYLIGSLIRNGIHKNYDVEAALSYIAYHLLSPVRRDGTPKQSLFTGFDEDRPFVPGTNPLEIRFKYSIRNLLRNIVSGQVPSLRTIKRPPGTLSIHSREEPEEGGISPDEIPGKITNTDAELVHDIESILRQKSTPDLDLVGMFRSIVLGQGTRQQKSLFGDRKTRVGRRLIVQAIQDYAEKTENWEMLRLLDRFKNFDATKPDPSIRAAMPPKPKVMISPDEQDFRSIVQVLETHNRRATLAILGKFRRRWMERQPRNPNSPHPNRLHDVLANMLVAGVLQKVGAAYVPGPGYERYLDSDIALATAKGDEVLGKIGARI